MEEIIKSYKGFNTDMTCCGGFQYEEGKEYETDSASCCNYGFHACEYPLDCFNYFSPNQSVFHEVEQSGEISKRNDDSKLASTKIKIGAEISIAGLVKAAIEYTTERAKDSGEKHNTGNRGASSNTGNWGASSNTGYMGASSNTGYRGASSNTGDYGASSNTGDCGASSNTGDCGASSNTGDSGASSNTGDGGASSNTGNRGASSNTGDGGASSNTGNRGASSNTGYRGASSNTGYRGASSNTGDGGASSNTGYRGASSNTGYCGASSNTGDYGASSNTGNCGASSNTGYRGSTIADHENSVAVAWGHESRAKGVIGATLVFAEWEKNDGYYLGEKSWTFKGSMMVRVDGEKIKDNTWYTMKNGQVIEAKEEDYIPD